MVIILNKISLKLGFWFLAVMLIVEVFLFYFLHTNIVDSRIEDELNSLQLRGNSHRDVLESSYNADTLNHIAFMEAKAETEVIVTDQNQSIIVSSSTVDHAERKILSEKISSVPREGKIAEDNWRNEKYISTVTPFTVNQNEQGYVYMFRSTNQVQNLIERLNHHFIIAAIVTFTLLIVTIVFLTRALTNPLVRMKNATEKLSKNDYSIDLPKLGNDELGELGRSIKTLTEELKHLKDERNEFLASISHELRTPLTYIKGYADVARRSTSNENDRQRYLDIIYEESEKLSRMLKDLFDLARIDRNSFEIDRQKIELCSFLNSIYEKILPAFKEREMELKIDCRISCHVLIDPIRFEQILINLLDNAIKHSEKNTKTMISAHRRHNRIVIEIRDQGHGIPKEDLPYIFERFYRVDKSRSRISGGTGLGLAIVKELIDAQEAAIEAKSELGIGSSFLITLDEVRE